MNEVPLGELIRPAGRKAGAEADLPVYSVTKHAGFVPSLEYFKKQVFSRDTEGYKLVERGDFAYATIHLDEGSVGIAPERALISPMYTVFSADACSIDPSYLIRFLKSPRALAHYPQLGRGAIHRRKAISLAALGSLMVPLPSLDEQRRIAAILDHADELRAKRRQAFNLLDSLTEASFLAIFGDPLQAEPDAMRPLPDLLTRAPQNGAYFPKDAYDPAGVEMVHMSDAFHRVVRRGSLKRVRASATEIMRYGIDQGDLLVARRSLNFEGSGKACMVPKSGEPLLFESSLIRVTPDPKRITVRYMFHYLNNTRVRGRWVLPRVTGATISGINQKALASIPVVVPSRAQLARFGDATAKLDDLRTYHERAAHAEEEFFSSLQGRAFRGDL